ncbi:Oxoglutarate/malate carrier protein [Aphelenchoides bicaudatus]|nr:Oxoglutarate/malate carrier protein [Aphelenchoides bicaudatus]
MSNVKEQRVARFYFGGVAGAIGACFTHPLDLLKVQLQTQQTKISLPQLVGVVYKSNGVLGFYNGLSASVLRQMTYSLARFAVYEGAKNQQNGPLLFYQKILLAAGSGAFGGLVGQPADLVNVRMQNDMKLPLDQRRNYKHAIDGLFRIPREEGFRVLFNGVSMTCVRAALVTIGQLGFYDQTKQVLMEKFGFFDNVKTHLFASFIAASAATIICQPIDVIKTRLMNSAPGEFKGVMDCFAYTAKTGPTAFFKGLVPAFVRLGPHTILMLVFFEQLRINFGYLPQKKRTE